MNNEHEITVKLRKTIAQVLGIKEEEIKDDSSMSNTDSWDSIRHINLIIALEQEFGIRFPDEEVPLLTSIQLISMAVLKAIDGKNINR